jgi:hypothetical protein
LVVAGQLAVSPQAPVPLVMVTVAVAGLVPLTPLTEQTPLAASTGAMAALVVAVTPNVLL